MVHEVEVLVVFGHPEQLVAPAIQTTYLSMATPPSFVVSFQETVIEPIPATTFTLVGGLGASAGITAPVEEVGEAPFALVAMTVKL
jgi:hypothetical protein